MARGPPKKRTPPAPPKEQQEQQPSTSKASLGRKATPVGVRVTRSSPVKIKKQAVKPKPLSSPSKSWSQSLPKSRGQSRAKNVQSEEFIPETQSDESDADQQPPSPIQVEGPLGAASSGNKEDDDNESDLDQEQPPAEPEPVPPSRSKKKQKKAGDVNEEEEPSTAEKRIQEVEEEKQLVKEGKNFLAFMSAEEISELLERIDKQCSPVDIFTVKYREKKVNWETVSFSSYGPRQCRAVWTFMRNQSRKHRILSEIVHEIKYKFSSDKTYHNKLIMSMPGYPQKPPTAIGGFQFFNRQEWERQKEKNEDLPNFVKFQRQCKDKYDALPTSEKKRYEELSKIALAEYERKVKQFYAENPGVAHLFEEFKNKEKPKKEKKERKTRKAAKSSTELNKKERTKIVKSKSIKVEYMDPYSDAPHPPQTPAALFMQSRMNRLDPPPTSEELPDAKNKYYDKWKRLSDQKRVKWIDFCLKQCLTYLEDIEEYKQAHPEYSVKSAIKVKSIFTNEEISLWETANDKPISPKLSVFDLFYEEYLQSDENINLPDDERRKSAISIWSGMDSYHKEMYGLKYKISIVEYKRQLQHFFGNLPEFLKPHCLKSIHKKFHKMLDDVDKVPIDADRKELEKYDLDTERKTKEEAEQNESLENRDQEPPKKKKKKRRIENEESEQEVDQYSGLKFQDSEQMSSQEVGEVDEGVKKKKKKKKHRHENEQYETITGDIFSDSYSEAQNTSHNEDDMDEHQNNETESDSRKQKKKLNVADKVQLGWSSEIKRFKEPTGFKPVKSQELILASYKPSFRRFTPDKEITKKDLREAIRGIFDGRPHLGRRYSVFYYYARYVCSQTYWLRMTETEELEKTACSMITTFLNLTKMEQELFIDQSFAFFERKVHGTVGTVKKEHRFTIGSSVFPEEPEPPPATASDLYLKEMKLKRAENPSFKYPAWKRVDVNAKTYYMKKLYYETKQYMRRYDRFMMSMTPNDLVEYTVTRAKLWEYQLYKPETITPAARGFTVPISRWENHVELEPEVGLVPLEMPISRIRNKDGSQEENPFVRSSKYAITVNRVKQAWRRRKPLPAESDEDPTDDEELGFSLYLSKPHELLKYRKRNRLRNIGQYLYPLDDMVKAKKMLPGMLPIKSIKVQTDKVPSKHIASQTVKVVSRSKKLTAKAVKRLRNPGVDAGKKKSPKHQNQRENGSRTYNMDILEQVNLAPDISMTEPAHSSDALSNPPWENDHEENDFNYELPPPIEPVAYVDHDCETGDILTLLS